MSYLSEFISYIISVGSSWPFCLEYIIYTLQFQQKLLISNENKNPSNEKSLYTPQADTGLYTYQC